MEFNINGCRFFYLINGISKNIDMIDQKCFISLGQINREEIGPTFGINTPISHG